MNILIKYFKKNLSNILYIYKCYLFLSQLFEFSLSYLVCWGICCEIMNAEHEEHVRLIGF